jgi:hypothetical protein
MTPSFFKRSGSSSVKFKSAIRTEINQYVQNLASQGFALWGTPIEYRQALSADQLREAAKDYASQNGCYLVVEVNDPNPMANPFNPYKYYLFQYQGQSQMPEPMEPPSRGGAGMAAQPPQKQVFAQFTCPYCRNVFTSYVNPGRNVLVCTSCKGQSMVDVPQPGAVQQQVNKAQAPSFGSIAHIKLQGKYASFDEMVIDCLEVLGKILMVEGNPLHFEDTGEFLYPFIRVKKAAYQHIGFRNMDMILLKEAIHDFRLVASEQHSQTQANVNPHKDELFSIKVLGEVNYLVLEEFKKLEDEQRRNIVNTLYQYLNAIVGTAQ